MERPARRPIAAVIGSARCDGEAERGALALGRCLVDRGFRVATGGLTGVMEYALRGASTSEAYREGDTLAFLPTAGTAGASPYADVLIRTGLQHGRNLVMVSSADVVFAVGGRAGTLNELALAWELSKPIIVVGECDGWATRLAGLRLDDRRTDVIEGPFAPEAAVARGRAIFDAGLVQPREYA